VEKILLKEVVVLKTFIEGTLPSYEDGACFFLTDKEKVTYSTTNKFDLPGVDIGSPNKKDGLAESAIREQKIIQKSLDRSVYGVRVHAHCGPIWSDDGSEITGAWVLVQPRLHKVANSFDYFAPIIANILPEGGLFYITDKEKFIRRQGSEKFDVPEVLLNSPIKNDGVAAIALQRKQPFSKDLDASVYGVPAMVAAYPLIDEDTGEAVGSFGLALPRQMANDLKEMATSLGRGMDEVSKAMGQIASATAEIGTNQNSLHGEIGKVQELIEKINNVMGFIKEIADETKMLGLNAAIEAARVGEAGMGFGVVAEEIRKLSAESKKTVVQIKDLTNQINKSMLETSGASQSTLATVEETASATQEVNASLEEMNALAQKLMQLAEEL
jgi:hypothetical protein